VGAPLTWTAALLVAACVAGEARAAAPPPKPSIPTNRIVNSDFELDANRDGIPDGWYHSDPQYWCGPKKDTPRWEALHKLWVEKHSVPANIPFRHPDTLEGDEHAYRWESPGCRSGHAISIDETTQQKWGEWNTVVTGVKPNTDYVLMGWRKQSPPAERKAGISPWLHVAAFGEMVPVKGTFSDDTWVPFHVRLHSGTFQGACRVGLILPQTASKVWIDRVEMFEGTLSDLPRFRLARRGAELDYPVHGTVYASPDLECPLFFDLMWSFHTGNGDPGLEIVIDLPKELDLTGGACGMGLTLGDFDVQPMTVAGRAYARVTIPVASGGKHAEFYSAGRRPVRLWLGSKKDAAGRGDLELFYHARWKSGRQAVRRLGVEIIRLPRLKQPRFLTVALGGLSTRLVTSRLPKLVAPPPKEPAEAKPGPADLATAGVNCLILDGSLHANAAEPLERAGITLGARVRLGANGVPKEAAARDRAGRIVAGMLCPTYESKDPVKELFAEPAALVRGGTVMLMTDLRPGLGRICYCPRCVHQFETVFKKQYPEVDVVPPTEFEAEPEKHAKLNAAWREFRTEKLAGLYERLRKELDTCRKELDPPARNVGKPLKLLAQVPTPARGVAPAGPCSDADYSRMGGVVLDVEVIEPEPYRSDAGGSPAWVGAETARLVKLLPPGGNAGVIVTAGPTDDSEAATAVVRRSDIRDQVLEALVAGARVVILDPFYAVDGKDLQQFCEGLAMLAPFEDLLAQGEPSDAAAVEDGRGSVRCLAQDDQVLLLVTDYSPRPADSVKLALKPKEKGRRGARTLIDVQTGQSLRKRVAPDARELTVPLGRRARLFYLGPPAKLPDAIRPRP
jgi:hypothetical protein